MPRNTGGTEKIQRVVTETLDQKIHKSKGLRWIGGLVVPGAILLIRELGDVGVLGTTGDSHDLPLWSQLVPWVVLVAAVAPEALKIIAQMVTRKGSPS